ncbi:MAG: response regulator transcription factor [Bacteroides sp.]|nr:response regulator transcription factor [Bacteroides sp.]
MDQPLKCIIIDDEPLARELLKSYVEKTPDLNLLGCFESAAEAVKHVVSGSVDLIFLDINMPLLNGIEFASVVPDDTSIIYVTAYEQYALQGFKVNALDYLLKPVSYPEFMKAVGKALMWHAMRKAYLSSNTSQPTSSIDLITVKSDYRLVQMKIDSIKYVEVQRDRVIFYRTQGDPVSSLMSMKELEELLPSDRFIRVHRSFIVNLNQVEIVERSRIVFGKTYIPISDTKKDEFMSRLKNNPNDNKNIQ